tara:strand:+ start:198 stop:398 length:201 start_codon:yes stop_codon:yes gene_type:complete
MALKKQFEEKGSTLNPLAGTLPKGPLKDANTLPVNNSFDKGRYQDYILDTDKAIDITGDSQDRTQG